MFAELTYMLQYGNRGGLKQKEPIKYKILILVRWFENDFMDNLFQVKE